MNACSVATHRQGTDRPVERLLDRLEAVKQTAPDRWLARCPGHGDRHPSLSIRETADGTVLLKCWSGCGTDDVTAAVGLELRDLFPKVDRPGDAPHRQPGSRPWPAIDVLRCLAAEAAVAAIGAADLAAGRALNEADVSRLAAAARRLGTALDAVEGL